MNGQDRRAPGRPPLDDNDPSVDVHVRMPSKQYDKTYEHSRRERESVPDVIRRALTKLLEDERG